MEPERQIEKVLRAYAKKRRDEAGAPLELHPATRRLLQGEAARRAPKPGDPHPWWKTLFLLTRPRLAFALSAVAITLVAAVLVVPALRSSTRAPETTFASRHAGEREAALAPPPASAPVPAVVEASQPVVRPEPVRGKGAPATVGPSRQSRDAATPAESLPAPPRPVQSKSAQPTSIQTRVNGKAFADATAAGDKFEETAPSPIPSLPPASIVAEQRPAELAKAGGPATPLKSVEGEAMAGASQGAVGRLSMGTGANTQLKMDFKRVDAAAQTAAALNVASQRYVQVATPPGSAGQRAFAGASTPQVLNSFQVLQNNQELEVVDEDGSVYRGYIEPEKALAQTPLNGTEKLKDALSGSDRLAPTQQMSVTSAQELSAQNYVFRVAGTNRSLNQNVEFSGNVIVLNDSYQYRNAPPSLGTAGQFQNITVNQALQPALSNSRISGTAVIGNQKEIQINALPASP
jgi:hypothetical protein